MQTFSRVLDLHSTIADHTKNRCLVFACVYVDGRLCLRNILEEGLVITGLFWLCKCKKNATAANKFPFYTLNLHWPQCKVSTQVCKLTLLRTEPTAPSLSTFLFSSRFVFLKYEGLNLTPLPTWHVRWNCWESLKAGFENNNCFTVYVEC